MSLSIDTHLLRLNSNLLTNKYCKFAKVKLGDFTLQATKREGTRSTSKQRSTSTRTSSSSSKRVTGTLCYVGTSFVKWKRLSKIKTRQLRFYDTILWYNSTIQFFDTILRYDRKRKAAPHNHLSWATHFRLITLFNNAGNVGSTQSRRRSLKIKKG